jgi:hypothetical protein
MHRRRGLNRVKDAIDRGGGPLPFFRIARQVSFVELHHIGIKVPDLLRQGITDRHRKIGHISVVLVH